MRYPCVRLQSLCTTAVCVLLALASMGGAYAQNYPPERPEPSRHENSWVPWSILGVVGAALLASQMKENKTYVDDDTLAANGPRFPDSYNVGTFAVQGYVQDRWPLVIDLRAMPDSCTWLEVNMEQRPVFSRLLDVDGKAGRQLITLRLPDRITDKARSALYFIRSEKPACSGGERPVPAGSSAASPIEIYGIGAGPRAVGSVAVDQLLFAPAAPKFPQERASVAYRLQSGFNHVAVEILRFDKQSPDQIEVRRIFAKRNFNVRPGTITDEPWDGRNQAGQRSLGLHRLQVRAWFTENDRSWVGAISPDSVRVER